MRNPTAVPSPGPLRWRRTVLGLGAAAAVTAVGLLAAPAHAAPVHAVTVHAATGADGVREAHVANPYAGAEPYVNPEWRAHAEAEPGGSRVSNTPTGIWIDQMSKITGTTGAMGLRAHLDAALAQGANLVQVVLDDLPGRDCTRWTTDGDFQRDELDRYRHEFVDPVVAIESDPRYGSLRIVNVVERDALADLVASRSWSGCSPAVDDTYVAGIRYALDALHRYSNLYTYLGIGGHGWLGWDDTAKAGTDLFVRTVQGTAAGFASVDGFISNLAGYAPLKEPFFDIGTTVSGRSIKQTKWVDWNNYVDELPFVTAFRARLVAAGFDPGIGMLVDTSRNGWGGPKRPTKPSTSTDLDTYVNASRIDRRTGADESCNQSGAGLGECPAVAPAAGIDAYVWMKPPGISDGAAPTQGTWTPGPGENAMCARSDPRWAGRASNRLTGALSGSPVKGAWFPEAFLELMAGAYPPLP